MPHHLGLLEDVPTYYVEEGHSELPRNETVMAALEDLLKKGKTAQLGETPITSTARAVVNGNRRRTFLKDQQIGAQLSKLARQIEAHGEERSAADTELEETARDAENVLRQIALGYEYAPDVLPHQKAAKPAPPARIYPLEIQLVRGDIIRFPTPLAFVGHYHNLPPTSAEADLDEALLHLIEKAHQQNMLDGSLGRLFFVPNADKYLLAKNALVVGLGEFGKLNRDDLRFAIMNVAFAAAHLKFTQIATVLLGTGRANLPLERAVRSILMGISDAFERLPKTESGISLQNLTLVVHDNHIVRDRREAICGVNK